MAVHPEEPTGTRLLKPVKLSSPKVTREEKETTETKSTTETEQSSSSTTPAEKVPEEASSSFVVEPDEDDVSQQSHTILLDREQLEKVRKRCLRGGRMTSVTGFVRDAIPWRYTQRRHPQERAC